jgi:hypothetical protein
LTAVGLSCPPLAGVSTDPLGREPFSRRLPGPARWCDARRTETVLFVGDDWAEDHHDVEIQDEAGRKLAARRLPEGAAGFARFHELIAVHLEAGSDPGQVAIGIETDRGLWVQALVAAGYVVYGLNPKQVARFKERYNLSGAKSDAADAHALADMVRTERHQLRPVAADSADAVAVKVVARAHQTLIWERTRTMLRLRSALREFFPAAQVAYAELGLTGADTLELLVRGACQVICVSQGILWPFRYITVGSYLMRDYIGTRPGNWMANALSAAFHPSVPVPRWPFSRTCPSPSIYRPVIFLIPR